MQRNRRRAVRARRKPHGMGMENYLPLLQSTSLFAGLEAESLRVLLGNVGAVLRTYSRGETLVLAGQTNRRVGVVQMCIRDRRYLLRKNGLDPDRDVKIEYYSEASEVTAQMAAAKKDAIAVLPQPCLLYTSQER